MKVLLDRNVERNAITHRSVLKPKTVRWGSNEFTVDILERQEFPPRPDEKFKIEQLPYLAALCESARANRIKFFTSFELRMERMRQRDSGDGYLGLDMLRGIDVSAANTPIDRAILIQAFGQSVGITEAEQMKFFDEIRDYRFIELRKTIGDSHIDDAFHLWTAEINNLDIFLTMDRRFLNAFNHAQSKIASKVSVLNPREVCTLLNEAPVEIDEMARRYPPFN